mmetsp:Transcript_10909/g.19450  ORF Transcript_10909/g.19450 Transcript_10909/m.19450 type:complete len:272 (+) Transcript_10909:48-863(+)
MAAAVARSGSRSPRREQPEDEDPDADPDGPAPDGLPQNFKGGFSEQMRLQRDFLAQFMRHSPAPEKTQRSSAPKEAAAGLPVEAAQFLLLSPGPGPATPWMGLPPHVACLAATLRLFARLLPGRVSETACDDLCRNFKASGLCASEELLEMVGSWGFDAKPVASAVEPLEAMVKGQPTTCCVFLESYVGVLEDPETHEEMEQEVGNHCVMIVGGDLLGPNYVTFDPWGPTGGEVAMWPDHVVKTAAAVAWVQLNPQAPTISPSSSAAGYSS